MNSVLAKIKRKNLTVLTNGVLGKIVIYAILISISYVFLYPLLKMASMAFLSPEDIINPEVEWIPQSLSFMNFKVSASVLGLPWTLLNSVWVSGAFAVAQTLVSALTGYAFARFNFKFKNFWFGMVLFSFVIPVPVVLIPRLMIFISLQSATGFQFIGNIIPQLLTSILGQGVNSAILILIFYNFFKMIPIALDEAAKIDGANAWQTFLQVTLRLSTTTIVTVFLFSFVWNWNETYVTSTFIRSGVRLLPMLLNSFDDVFGSYASSMPPEAGGSRINEAYKMAATFVSILPLLIMYLFGQKLFIEGIENTGIK